MDCKRASQLIAQGMDRPLRWRERLGLYAHLAFCGMCRRFFRQLRLMRTAVRCMVNHAENDESVRLSGKARERISRVLDQQS